jgi:regulator of cell morphogenesis and NO signaling
MNNYEINSMTVGEIVAKDFRAATLFKEAGIDFCCGGKKGFSESCSEKGIDPKLLEEKIISLESVPDSSLHNFNEWDPGFLCDYIINTHHKYVLKTLPELVFYTSKLAEVHGERHVELKEIADLFLQVNNELLQHLESEEQVFFPSVKEFMASGSQLSKETILSEIRHLSSEHEFAGGAIDRINGMTNGYIVPSDGCNTYIVAFKMLQSFEDDLHIHVHLENNVLFPKLLELIKK